MGFGRMRASELAECFIRTTPQRTTRPTALGAANALSTAVAPKYPHKARTTDENGWSVVVSKKRSKANNSGDNLRAIGLQPDGRLGAPPLLAFVQQILVEAKGRSCTVGLDTLEWQVIQR